MNIATNHIRTMVHMPEEAQPHSADSVSSAALIHPLTLEESLEENSGQALHLLLESVHKYGREAEDSMDAQLESQQEAFLEQVESLLGQAGVVLQEKLTIGLSEYNTLLLQSNEQNDILLDILGTSDELLQRFLDLRALAIMSQGLHYINASAHGDVGPLLPQYRMCLKGSLSHFYLKLL